MSDNSAQFDPSATPDYADRARQVAADGDHSDSLVRIAVEATDHVRRVMDLLTEEKDEHAETRRQLGQAALVIAQLEQENAALRAASETDPKTGLGSEVALAKARAELNTQISRQVTDRRENPIEFTWLVCDLDGFSDINRAVGHDTADRLLVEYARRIREELLRDGDKAFRRGEASDEVEVIMYGLTVKGRAADAIKKRFDAMAKSLFAEFAGMLDAEGRHAEAAALRSAKLSGTSVGVASYDSAKHGSAGEPEAAANLDMRRTKVGRRRTAGLDPTTKDIFPPEVWDTILNN